MNSSVSEARTYLTLSRVSASRYRGLSKLRDEGLVILKEVKMVFGRHLFWALIEQKNCCYIGE
jgi:hypothetical protein